MNQPLRSTNESAKKNPKRKRRVVEEVYNYVPEEYSCNKKRFAEQYYEKRELLMNLQENQKYLCYNPTSQSEIQKNVQALQILKGSYYERVLLSSNKERKKRNLEDGEIDKNSNSNSNSKVKKQKKRSIVEKAQSVSKQLHFDYSKKFHQEENTVKKTTILNHPPANNTTQINPFHITQLAQSNISYQEYLKEKQRHLINSIPTLVPPPPKPATLSKYEASMEEKFKCLMADHNMVQNDSKKQYINEPFPEILTNYEQQELLKVWKQRNFQDFNTWVQKSGAKLVMTFENELQEEPKNQKKKQIFHCYMELKFDVEEMELEMQRQAVQFEVNIQPDWTQDEYFQNKNKNVQSMRKILTQNTTIPVKAFSDNKKEAKKKAFESLYKELASKNLLCLGIRYKSYLDFVLTFHDVPSHTAQFHEIYNQKLKEDDRRNISSNKDKIMNKLHKISKKIQECIAKDLFEEACKELQKISEYGILEWRWVAFLWAYCIKRRKPTEMKLLIDIMQSRQYKQKESGEEYFGEISLKYHNLTNQPYLSVGGDLVFSDQNQLIKDSVNRILRTQYKDAVRLESTNPFDFYDRFNLEVSDEQMPKQTMQVDNTEPIPRIFDENLHNVIQQTYTIPLKMNKPQYNYYHHLAFAGSYMSQPQNQYQQLQQKKLSKEADLKSNNLYHEIINEKKDPFINYLPLEVVSNMYDSLIYVASDPEFALQVCEIIYRYAKIDTDQFINPACAYYYTNKKVQIVQEQIETIANSLYTNKFIQLKSHKHSSYITNIKGSIKPIGTLFEKDVFTFYSKENAGTLEKKLLKRNQADGSHYHHQICEDEMVILSCFFKPSYDKPFMKPTGDKLIDYFNDNSRKRDLQIYEEDDNPNPDGGKSRIRISHNEEDYTYSQAYVDSISEYGNKIEYAVLAYVKDIQKDLCIKLYILNPNLSIFSEPRTWKITKLHNLGIYERYNESLVKCVTSGESMSSVISKVLTAPPLTNIYHLRSLAETIVDKEMPIQNKDLNPSQYQALLAAHRQSITLIQAPDGSGKMRILKKLINLWTNQNAKLKILLTVHSADRQRQIYHALKTADINCVEVSEKQTTKIEFTGLRTHVPDYEKIHNSMPRYYHSLKKALLCSRVVITNCSSSNYSVLKGVFFHKVIILDAENISEIACLEAITKQCSQLVLIGDHLQQVAYTNNLFSQSRGYGISLFERLVREGIRPFLLCQNYKMSYHVLQFTSKFFYKNLVFPTIRNKDSTKPSILGDESSTNIITGYEQFLEPLQIETDIENYVWPNIQIKANFINVQGQELRRGDSIVNLKELEVLIHTTLYLFKSKTISKESLCIVTPYRAQKQLILAELNYHIVNNPQLFGLDEVEVLNIKSAIDVVHVKTIEEVDKQFDFILLSTCRSNKEGRLGSMRDPRRMNAVISKTNEALIVIGDISTLDNEQIWREFIQWSKDRGLLCQYIN